MVGVSLDFGHLERKKGQRKLGQKNGEIVGETGRKKKEKLWNNEREEQGERQKDQTYNPSLQPSNLC